MRRSNELLVLCEAMLNTEAEQPLCTFEGRDLVRNTGLTPSRVYPLLSRMCTEGWLLPLVVGGVRRYELTRRGRRELERSAVAIANRSKSGQDGLHQ